VSGLSGLLQRPDPRRPPDQISRTVRLVRFGDYSSL